MYILSELYNFYAFTAVEKHKYLYNKKRYSKKEDAILLKAIP